MPPVPAAASSGTGEASRRRPAGTRGRSAPARRGQPVPASARPAALGSGHRSDPGLAADDGREARARDDRSAAAAPIRFCGHGVGWSMMGATHSPIRIVDGRLLVEDLPASQLAARFGTPLYVHSEAQLRANVLAWREALAASWRHGPTRAL